MTTNLNFSKNYRIKCALILGATNNINHNFPEEITNGLITLDILSAQVKCKNAIVVIIPLLPHEIKSSLRQGNIDVTNTLNFLIVLNIISTLPNIKPNG